MLLQQNHGKLEWNGSDLLDIDPIISWLYDTCNLDVKLRRSSIHLGLSSGEKKKRGERKKRGGWHLSLFWSIWPCGFNETELLCHFSTSSLLSFLPAVLSRAPHSSLPFCSTYFIELQCLLSSSDALLSVDWDHLWTSKAGHLLATIFQKSTWLPVSLHDYSYYCFFVGFSKAVFSYLSTIS